MSGPTHTVWLGALLYVACAAPPGPQSTAAAYREMRAAEADLERSAARRQTQPPGPSREALNTAICDAAARVCGLAEELAEADAHARCGAARSRCAAIGGDGKGAR